MPYKDAEAKRKHEREYSAKNREKLNAQHRITYAKRGTPGRHLDHRVVEQNRKYQIAHPEIRKKAALNYRKNHPLRYMIQKSRAQAKQKGIEHTITERDVYWPKCCPILGIELIYDFDSRCPTRDSTPSLDRLDNNLGYVPGNVFVLSQRANRLKGDGTAEEHRDVADYMDRAASGKIGVQQADIIDLPTRPMKAWRVTTNL